MTVAEMNLIFVDVEADGDTPISGIMAEFGAVHYGTRKAEGLIDEAGGFELLAKSIEVGGDPGGRPVVKAEVLRRVWEANPGVVDPIIDRGKKADAKRATERWRQAQRNG